MSVVNSSQKFIARNRTPRVQIEYDVEVYGSEKRIELPFVMGVLADLSGKPAEPLLPVADRKFLEVDVDNFDERMKAIQPRGPRQPERIAQVHLPRGQVQRALAAGIAPAPQQHGVGA